MIRLFVRLCLIFDRRDWFIFGIIAGWCIGEFVTGYEIC